MVYKKAIRDKIPEIIKDSGFSCNVEKLEDAEFLKKLDKKLDEEIAEYKENGTVEELVDVIEIIQRISELRGVSAKHFQGIRDDKVKKRGAFKENLFLIDTSKD